MFSFKKNASSAVSASVNFSRRQYLTAAASLAGASALGLGMAENALAQAVKAAAGQKGMQLVLLGTKGGPRVGGERSNPASLLLIDGEPIVVDCGYGVAAQMVKAGVALPRLSKVFLTHMHSDHNLEYGPLLYSAWSAGLRNPVGVWGPTTLDSMTKAFMESMKFDIDIRIPDESKPDLRKLVQTHEFSKPGVLLENDKVKVTAVRNIHPPIEDSFAFRFDTADRSITFSGDTTYCPAVAELAKGSDVLVHEVIYVPAVDAMVKRVPNAATLKEHLLACHTTSEDVGRIAAAAGVKKLVLSHIVPGDDPSITDEMLIADVRKHFSGEVIVGKELMVI